MTIGVPPLSSALPVAAERAAFTQPWANWLNAVFLSLFGWRKSYTGTLSKTWGLIGAGAEASQTVSILGAQTGDSVHVQPATKTTGIIEVGVVTAVDTVTVYAMNTSAGGITPGAKLYRIVLWQQ